MGSACSCCSDDTEKGLPFPGEKIPHVVAQLKFNAHRKHIIKALHAVLEVGLHEMTSLFTPSSSGASSKTDFDDLIAALDRTLLNLDSTLSSKERLEVINRSVPLDKQTLRDRLFEWSTGKAGANDAASLNRIRSQSLAPRGQGVSSHQRHYLPRILELWFQADKDCSGSLTASEVKQLLHEINIDVPSSKVQEMIRKVDRPVNGTGEGNGEVEFGEFVLLYNHLTMIPSITAITRRLGIAVRHAPSSPESRARLGVSTNAMSESSKTTVRLSSGQQAEGEITVIPEDAIHDFLLNEQKESASLIKEISSNIGTLRTYGAPPQKKYSPASKSPARGGGDVELSERLLSPSNDAEITSCTGGVWGVSEREFILFLLDAACNSWINPRECDVWNDMTQPYTHYFIDSSHNTYLSGHQLQGQSSCDMYKKALLNGCRCIELDCWDGPNGDPIVTHGFTLTSTIRFFDVIQTIKQYAFQLSPYPVMLSIELHCSPPQQEKMVEMMIQAFGRDLLTAADAEASQLTGREFSPEGLRNKILVKGKRLPGGLLPPPSAEEVLLEQQQEESLVAEKQTSLAKESSSPSQVMNPTQAKGEAAHKKHQAVTESLNRVTYIAAMPFVDCVTQLTKPHYGVASVDENKIEKWGKEGVQPYVDVAKQFLIRVYPKGLRTDSSNYSPQPSWNCGAQLVALNIQTYDEGYRLNRYRFRCNGQCGMLLKPLAMRLPNVNVASCLTEEWSVHVKVICGVQLPKPQRSTRGEVIDPFIELFISGYGSDDTSTNRKRTRVIDNNGFNPVWNEEFSFTVKFPEMAMLCIQVHEKDPLTTELIADNAVSLTALREGYRCVPLYVSGGELPSPTCVFCHFEINKKGTPYDSSAVAMQQQQQHHDEPAVVIPSMAVPLDDFVKARLDML